MVDSVAATACIGPRTRAAAATRAWSRARAGTWEADFVKRRLTWSSKLYRLHGLSSFEPLRWDEYVNRIIHPEDRANVVATPAELAAGTQQRQLDRDFRIIRPDGQTIWVSAVGGVEQLEGGKLVRAMGIIRDISLRKRAELAQQQADRFIARIADVAPTLIYVYDIASGRRVYNNGWLPHALGYDYEPDINDREFVDRMLHPDDRNGSRPTVARMRTSRTGLFPTSSIERGTSMAPGVGC